MVFVWSPPDLNCVRVLTFGVQINVLLVVIYGLVRLMLCIPVPLML